MTKQAEKIFKRFFGKNSSKSQLLKY